MTAIEAKATSSETCNDEFFNSLNSVVQLFTAHSVCVDEKAALAAFDAIPIQSESQRKWVTYWKAKVLLAVVANINGELIRMGSTGRAAKARKYVRCESKAIRMLEQLIPSCFESVPEHERELVLGAMLKLGQLYGCWKGTDLICRVAAHARYHNSPLRKEAEKTYREFCELTLKYTFEGLENSYKEIASLEDDREEGDAA